MQQHPPHRSLSPYNLFHGLCEYPCVTSYDLMLLVGNMNTFRPRDHVSYLTVSFPSQDPSISLVYIRWRFYGQYAYLFYRYFKPHVYLFFNLYKYSFVGSWSSLISLNSSPTFLCIFIQIYLLCVNTYVYIYIYIYICVVPFCSRHDLIDLRSYYPGPLLPSSLASQAKWFGTLDVQLRSLISMSGLVSLWPRICLIFLCIFSFRGSLSYGTLWSILYRLCSNLIVSLGHQISFGAKLVMT